MPKNDFLFSDTERMKRLFEAVGLGLPMTSCCGYAGIGYQTFYSWMKKGEEQPDSKYGDFAREIGRLKAEVVKKYVETIEKVATDPNDPNWKAAIEFLKHRFPETWGKKLHEHDVKVETNCVSYEEMGNLLKKANNSMRELYDDSPLMLRDFLLFLTDAENPKALIHMRTIRDFLDEPREDVIEGEVKAISAKTV